MKCKDLFMILQHILVDTININMNNNEIETSSLQSLELILIVFDHYF